LPLSDSVGPRRSTSASITIGLVIGVLLGAGIGFWIGRNTAPPTAHRGQPPAQPADQFVPAAPSALGPAADTASPAPAAPVVAPQQTDPPAASPAKDERTVKAPIAGSLYATLARELEGREADILSAQIGRLLVWWLDAGRDVLKGDRVEVLYRPIKGPGQLRILVLRYYSTKLDQTFEAYFYKPQGAAYGRYYDQEGVEVEQRLNNPPLDEYEQITELMDLGGRKHRGVDFKVDVGTPVRAPFEAKVNRRNWNTRRNGNCLQLTYTKTGMTALFLHLDEVLPATRPGKTVAAGTQVAKSGNTGRSTAPHLHYELRSRSGKLLNPFDVHKTTRRKLEGDQLALLKRQQASMLARLQGAAATSGDSE